MKRLLDWLKGYRYVNDFRYKSVDPHYRVSCSGCTYDDLGPDDVPCCNCCTYNPPFRSYYLERRYN